MAKPFEIPMINTLYQYKFHQATADIHKHSQKPSNSVQNECPKSD